MIAWIEVQGLRNLEPQRVPLGELVVVTGANAQGKSSLLEALYMLATTRSYRTREPRDAIAYGAEFLRLAGALPGPGREVTELAFSLARIRGERLLSVGQCTAKLAEYLALLPTLALSGESTRIVAGSPSERRRLMDRATAAADPAHLADLGEYRRALAHRNQLLRSGAPGQPADAVLEPWDELVGGAGDRIARRRAQQVAAWQDDIASWPELFPEGASARLVYREAGHDPAGTTLAQRLAQRREQDRREGHTTIGPHRDDLRLELEGKDLFRFGSAGQVRSALVALTLAQARQVQRTRGGARPLLVLDDADTDLDPTRLTGLLEAAAREGQVVAATSKPGAPVPERAARWTARSGRIEPGP